MVDNTDCDGPGGEGKTGRRVVGEREEESWAKAQIGRGNRGRPREGKRERKVGPRPRLAWGWAQKEKGKGGMFSELFL